LEALSYCWGGQQPVTMTSSTAQDITDGILVSVLPKTLQDAIVVTHKLGLRYLWVDALCIIQDSPQDLNREIAKMAETFQGAFITISAASASSVHQGFLRDRQWRSSICLQLPYESGTATNGSVLIEQERRTYDSSEDPINLRAWT
jgi:hypothetical protein